MAGSASTVPTKPQGSGDAAKMIVAGLLAGIVVGLPALLAGGVLAALARRRPVLRWVLAALAVAGVLVMLRLWRQEIASEIRAVLRLLSPLIRGKASGAMLWDALSILWLHTVPAAPLVGVLGAYFWPRSAEERQAEADRQAAIKRERAVAVAYQQAARAPDVVQGRMREQGKDELLGVIGFAGEGITFRPYGRASRWAVYPPGDLNRHAVVIGESGKGKTEFFLRLAFLAATYGWRVYVIDAKGNRQFAIQFVAAMARAGVRDVAVFPRRACDGWRGDHELIYGKLLACLDFSEPYYKNTVEAAVRLAVYAGEPPRSSAEFLRRFSLEFLADAYANDPVGLQRLGRLKPELLDSAAMRYDAFFASAIGAFDGDWSFEDVRAGYFLLPAIEQREQARTMGRYLVEDFAQAVTARLPKDDHSLLIIDEYPALAGAGEAARLFEQVRSPHGRGGAGVIVGSQSYAGLGVDADRMIYAANATVVFQTAEAERLVARAGQKLTARRSYTRGSGAPASASGGTPRGPVETFSQREERDFVVSPEAVKGLAAGQCYIIPSGGYQQLTVSRVLFTDDELERARQRAFPRVRRREHPIVISPMPGVPVSNQLSQEPEASYEPSLEDTPLLLRKPETPEVDF